jgi:transcriptional regulator with XRE-family HTH domain
MASRPRVITQSRKITFGPDQHEASGVLRVFGQHLTLLRAEANLSQQRLADRCFLRDSHISKFERGLRVPNLLALLTLASSLGVSMDSLTEGLTAPARRASVAELRELLARRPGISTDAAAESLQLPPWYVKELVLHLQSVGTVLRERKGATSGLWLAPTHPTEG